MHLLTAPDRFFLPSTLPWVELTRLTEDRQGNKVGHKAQHRDNMAWAKRCEVTIGAIYQESNVSTSDETAFRKVYEQILQEVEAGMWGGLVVWRADRLTRQSFEFERCLKIFKPKRALIAASYDNVSTINPDGEDRIRTQVAQAQKEIANQKIRIKANSDQRKEDGRYHGGGFRPYGFVGAKKDKHTERVKNSGKVGVKQIESEVELLKEAADRIAWKAWSYKDVVEDWHSRTPPVYGANGAPWSTATLKTILTSHRMIGRQLVKTVDPETGVASEKTVKAVWKPVLDKKTWSQLVSLGTTATHRQGKIKYLLSPILVCGRCQKGLTGCIRKYSKAGVMAPTETYRCRSGTNDKARGACGKLSVLAKPVENIVLALIFERISRTEQVGQGVKETDDLNHAINRQNAQVVKLKSELAALVANQSTSDRLDFTEFKQIREPLVRDRAEAEAKLNLLVKQLHIPHPINEDWSDLWVWFDNLTSGQQAKFIQAHVKEVVVLPPGRSGRYFKPDRVQVTLADAQEIDGDRD